MTWGVVVAVLLIGSMMRSSGQSTIDFEATEDERIRIVWDDSLADYALERALDLTSPTVWGDVTGAELSETGGSYALDPLIEQQFFRLKLDRPDKIVAMSESAGEVDIELAVPPNPFGITTTIIAAEVPDNGLVKRRNGSTVLEGHAFLVLQLLRLTFTPTGGAGVSQFRYTVDYGDGIVDTVTVELTVVSAGGGAGLSLSGDIWDDIVVAGTGSDTLTGNRGADRFVFRNGDAGDNTLTDFSLEERDLFDVRDALSSLDVEETGSALDPHVDFQFDGANTLAAFDLEADGTPEFSLLFENVDLVGGQDDAAIIDGLISGGNGNFLGGETIIVHSTADSGPGSLRNAMLAADAGDAILFDSIVFPPEAPATITLDRRLPNVWQGNLTIDASNAGVILDGGEINPSVSAQGLTISSNSNTVRGIQIVNFSDVGIGLVSGASNNTIGGDPEAGAGPNGQGNVLGGNQGFGIGIWGEDTAFNSILGNAIGVDSTGLVSMANLEGGIIIDLGAHDNVIGPENLIALNEGGGVSIGSPNSIGNTVSQNSIHSNERLAINLAQGGNGGLMRPLILDFDLAAQTISGLACPSCVVEIFSDDGFEGETYEGTVTADSLGQFTFIKGAPFAGPNLTATASSPDGSTSQFSFPTSGPTRSTDLQVGNDLLKTRLLSKLASELEDNRISAGASFDVGQTNVLGMSWADSMTIDEKEFATVPESGAYSKYIIPSDADNAATGMADLGIEIIYSLAFWDEEIEPQEGYKRFKDEEEIQRYLDYVRFIVQNFKDRIQWYEMINEPRSNEGGEFDQQNIDVEDYVEVTKRVAQVIREELPEAKIIVGAVVLFYDGAYLFDILDSDVLPLVDGISWHPFYGTSPEYQSEYYYDYDTIVRDIQDTAAANGFEGIFQVQELDWGTTGVNNPDQPIYSETVAAKYLARGIMINLGLDVIAGFGGTGAWGEAEWRFARVVSNLSTIMEGNAVTELPMDLQTVATKVRAYSFSLLGGEKVLAIWTDDAAVDEDPGVSSTLTFPDLAASTVTAIDALNGFEQELDFEVVDGDLVIEGLLVRDYPLILRLED